MIRLILADDHHLVRQGLRALLERAPDVEVLGEAADGYEAIALTERLRPDVLVLDINMPGMTGIQVLEQFHNRKIATAAVMLSMYSDETLVRQALQKGARGYLLKHSVSEELLLAIRAANGGELYLSPEISSKVVSGFLSTASTDESRSGFERLSPREREVLKLIAEGATNQAIATWTGISVKTVESHRANLMVKLNVRDVPGLVRVALKHGLIFLDE
jgi:DNA-binding NarL/FixJ family response regulator